jgi:hypothetical protein
VSLLVRYGTAFLLIRDAVRSVPCSVEWEVAWCDRSTSGRDLNQMNLNLYKGEFKINTTNPANPT